jgi:CheY-like chemotaxis protein
LTDAAILLVDDEKTVLRALKEQLRGVFGSRFTYETAEQVAEAWEVIDELVEDDVSIVVIVSDWLMPGVRGDEFLLAVQQRFPDTVRIMLTGQADDDAIARVRESGGARRVLAKPWSIDELTAEIEAGLVD